MRVYVPRGRNALQDTPPARVPAARPITAGRPSREFWDIFAFPYPNPKLDEIQNTKRRRLSREAVIASLVQLGIAAMDTAGVQGVDALRRFIYQYGVPIPSNEIFDYQRYFALLYFPLAFMIVRALPIVTLSLNTPAGSQTNFGTAANAARGAIYGPGWQLYTQTLAAIIDAIAQTHGLPARQVGHPLLEVAAYMGAFAIFYAAFGRLGPQYAAANRLGNLERYLDRDGLRHEGAMASGFDATLVHFMGVFFTYGITIIALGGFRSLGADYMGIEFPEDQFHVALVQAFGHTALTAMAMGVATGFQRAHRERLIHYDRNLERRATRQRLVNGLGYTQEQATALLTDLRRRFNLDAQIDQLQAHIRMRQAQVIAGMLSGGLTAAASVAFQRSPWMDFASDVPLRATQQLNLGMTFLAGSIMGMIPYLGVPFRETGMFPDLQGQQRDAYKKFREGPVVQRDGPQALYDLLEGLMPRNQENAPSPEDLQRLLENYYGPEWFDQNGIWRRHPDSDREPDV